ncbi:glutamyl-tRNA reductase [Tindallia magadiensis]|uniref:Glutamyl-tRNA reductase n=1 Tax=Tindallia magadiensis TaxID=69895 RepID=A0A1I3AXK9_9FIRM|nr:glutamyl-tRNA reductase [Tindallia magadiensis]SFH54825.1 glutamyl-tRNA reductase [Tindallia magadiensis]
MNIGIYGMHYKNTPVKIRERAAFKASGLESAYHTILSLEGINSCVILSTCNRSQLIYEADDGVDGKKKLDSFFQEYFGFSDEEIETYCHHEVPAVSMFFRMCCGLDSLVLGEDQILGQIKEAYYAARDFGATSKALNKLFQNGITLGKKIKYETGISENSLSIASIAVKQGEKIFGLLNQTKVLIVGRGEMCRRAIKHLISLNVGYIYIATRGELLTGIGKHPYTKVTRIPFDDRYEVIADVDWIISATSAPHQVIEKHYFSKHYCQDKNMLITDIALPRDVDPNISDIPGVQLYDIDDLEEVANENMLKRSGKLKLIEKRIQEKNREFFDWYRCLPVYPRIRAIQHHSQEVTEVELERLFNQMPHLSQKDRDNIEAFVYSLAKKMWRTPIQQLKQVGLEGKGKEAGELLDRLLTCDYMSVEEKMDKEYGKEKY